MKFSVLAKQSISFGVFIRIFHRPPLADTTTTTTTTTHPRAQTRLPYLFRARNGPVRSAAAAQPFQPYLANRRPLPQRTVSLKQALTFCVCTCSIWISITLERVSSVCAIPFFAEPIRVPWRLPAHLADLAAPKPHQPLLHFTGSIRIRQSCVHPR